MAGHIRPELFAFFRELKENNTREWFAANRRRYEHDVQEPLLQFIREFGLRLASVGPEFVADSRKVGGSLFRIQRDIRFSKDKSPYKTHAGLQFRHRQAGSVHAPAFYLHLEPEECLLALGVWRPDRPALEAIRRRIADYPDEWEAVVTASSCRRFVFEGDPLKRPPKGYPPDHPMIGYLMCRDFLLCEYFPETQAFSEDFADWCASACRDGSPFMQFLCRALHLFW